MTRQGPGAKGPGAGGQGPGGRTRQGPVGNERGYALLFVFLMASVVALYLYMQLPRVAFESERDKEQTLIDRGEQYKRAIQLYVAAVKKFPQKIEDLEDTNNKRYLRRRYIDPMTGKDEWRLIHVNAAGQLTDSLVQAPPCAPGQNPGSSPTGSTPGSATSTGTSSSNTAPAASSTGLSSTSNGPGNPSSSSNCTPTGTPNGAAGSTGTAGTATASNGTAGANGATGTDPNDVNAAVRKRPSDVVGNAYTQQAGADPNDPSTWAPITLAAPTATGQPPSGAVGFNGGLLGQQTANGGQAPAAGGAFPLPGQPGFNPQQNQFKIDQNGQLVPIVPAQPGQQTAQNNGNGQQPPATQPYVQPPTLGGVPPTIAGPGGNSVNAGTGVAPQNQATTAINNMLTGATPQAGLGTANGMMTGGIAGVASTFKGPSIKIYGTRQKYQEWEFIFSLNNQQGGAGQARNPLGAPGQNGLGSTTPGSTTPGSTPGTTGGSTTGSTTPGTTGNPN
jgi:hypothetical protein